MTSRATIVLPTSSVMTFVLTLVLLPKRSMLLTGAVIAIVAASRLPIVRSSPAPAPGGGGPPTHPTRPTTPSPDPMPPISGANARPGLTDAQEADLGTDAYSIDSDRDGRLDGDEVAAGTNPLWANKPQNAAAQAEVDPIESVELTVPQATVAEVEIVDLPARTISNDLDTTASDEIEVTAPDTDDLELIDG